MTSVAERRVEVAGLLCGALLFVGAQVVLFVFWRRWFDPSGSYPTWFLDTGRAVGFTAAWFVVGTFVGTLYAPPRTGRVGRRILAVAAGAALAMTVVLFIVGPGTIFPIVIVIGAAIISVSVGAGTAVAMAAREWIARRS